jgi:hypothetical protein
MGHLFTFALAECVLLEANTKKVTSGALSKRRDLKEWNVWELALHDWMYSGWVGL